MELKRYQANTRDALKAFLEQARLFGPKTAYDGIVRDPDRAQRLGRHADYYRPLPALPGAPYVCLRLPTGGGKTVLAAHCVKTVADAWMDVEYPVVLWLVPSNTIRRQTVEALKNRRHPYRMVLDEMFGQRVRVFDIGDFEQIPVQDIGGQACVVVGTIQTLRVTNTEGRKVYAHNESMEPHFSRVPANMPGLELRPDGGVKYSFANLLHVCRPLMIVDEAHNAMTGLTREMQQRVNPSAIVEFTATPRSGSNILYSVTAQELKDEEMIKLPIVLTEHRSWQSAVTDAIARRGALEEEAKREREYVRPIVLFQAQPKNQEVTVEVLKTHLIDVENLPPERIAVVTGDQRELDGIDLFDRSCPIEYVITVEALKEGWDCSFAYVFCSVANIRSATDTEQLLGRVMRMPYAKRRRAAALNRAYAHVMAPAFSDAVDAICDCLTQMGFDEAEAEENIEQGQQRELDEGIGGLFAARERPPAEFRHQLPADPRVLDALRKVETDGVRVEADEAGVPTLRVTGVLSGAAEAKVIAALPEAHRESFRRAVARYRINVPEDAAAVLRGKRFIVPALMAEVQGELEFADVDRFMEAVDWSLADCPSRLEPGEFDLREKADSFEIDLNGNRVVVEIGGEQDILPLNIDVQGWDEAGLVRWLDRQLRQPDIRQGELIRWLNDVVHDLVQSRRMPIAALMRVRQPLAAKLREKIAKARQAARDNAYQRFLFDPGAKVELSFDEAFAFEFKHGMYDGQRMYRGRFRFRKHFLGPDHVPAFDGKAQGEEELCASQIDSLEEVDFWVRNVSQHPNSFRLPTSTYKHYPDFMLRLKDGRTMAVEYKGADRVSNDETRERRTIGALWERVSGGKALYLIVEKLLDGKGPREQIKQKIASSR